MTTNPQDLDAPHDTFLALTSVKAVHFTELCRRVRAGKASEDEAATAILDLCRDNERLAVLAGKRAAEKAEVVAENAALRRDMLAAEAAATERAAKVFQDDSNLSHRICCNGQDCGCQGATAEDYVLFRLGELRTPEATSALDAAKRAERAQALRDATKALTNGANGTSLADQIRVITAMIPEGE